MRRVVEEPIGEEELERARENVKGRTVLGLESTSTRMTRLGSSVLGGVPLLSIDEMLAAVDAVSVEEVSALARELYSPERLSAAGVGADEDCFRAGVASVSPVLAAA